MSRSYIATSTLPEEEKLIEKRRNYESLDEFAREEGIEAVLLFLSRSPTVIQNIGGDGIYRHTKMKTVNYTVKANK